MKHVLTIFLHFLARARVRTAALAVAPLAALQASPVWAELPTINPPAEAIGGGAVADGDWMGAMGGYFKVGFTIAALVLVAGGFIYVLMGSWNRWINYSNGRIELAELVIYFIMAAVFGLFLVIFATYALSTLA